MKQFWQENKGSISILAIISVVGVLMILLLSINIGNIYAKKSLVEDTAEALAPILLANQITRTIPPATGTLPTTKNALQTAQDIISSNENTALSGATLIPIFGIWNDTKVALGQIPFCDFDDTLCMSSANLINPKVTRTDPDFNQVVLGANENFAITFQVQYPALPLDSLLKFDLLILNGKAVRKTKLPTKLDTGIFPSPDPDNGEDCCCKAAALANDTNTITVSGGFFIFKNIECWKDYPPISDPNPDNCEPTSYFPLTYEKPGDGVCDEKCEAFSFWGSGSDASKTCDYFAACHDTIWESFFSGKIFEYFLEIRRCWFGKTFLELLIESIERVTTTVDEAWDKWA